MFGDRHLKMAAALLRACSIRHRQGSVTANPWLWSTPRDTGGASPGYTHFQNVLQPVTQSTRSVCERWQARQAPSPTRLWLHRGPASPGHRERLGRQTREGEPVIYELFVIYRLQESQPGGSRSSVRDGDNKQIYVKVFEAHKNQARHLRTNSPL